MRFIQRTEQNIIPAKYLKSAEKMGAPGLLAEILYGRGINTLELLQEYLSPSSEQLRDAGEMEGMRQAANLLEDAATKGERICIYGDYDVDGVCAVAILYNCLTVYLGVSDVQWYIPDRQSEGYGLNENAIREIAGKGTKLLITVDCGISSAREIALASSLGMRTIVTDHHEMNGTLPPADAVISPKREDQKYRFRDLCGAATAGKLVEYLLGYDSMEESLDLMALATVADMVPLIGENRAIVALGIARMNENLRPGLRALSMFALKPGESITAEKLAYQFAPRLNAAGRMDTANRCVELLLSMDDDEAKDIALQLERLNQNRRDASDLLIEEAEKQLKQEWSPCIDRGIVLWNPEWKTGLLGLAAAYFVKKYYRPTILLGGDGDVLYGSCRSVPGVPIFKALQACESLLVTGGGHEMAGGVSIRSENYHAFRAAFLSVLDKAPADCFLPVEYYDKRISLEEISLDSVRLIQKMEPFGQGNPVPRLLVEQVLLNDVVLMGADRTHYRGILTQDGTSVAAVAFRKKPPEQWSFGMETYDAILEPREHLFRGQTNLQVSICEIQPSDSGKHLLNIIDANLPSMRRSFWEQIYFTDEIATDRIDKLSSQDAVALLNESPYGCLVLCSDPQAAKMIGITERFASVLKNLHICVGTLPEDYDGGNTLLLAPERRKVDLRGFRCIILADRIMLPFCPNLWGNELQNVRIGAIIWDNLGGWPEEMASPWDLLSLRKAYVYCRDFLRGTTQYSTITAITDALAEGLGCPRWKMAIAISIFLETGLMLRIHSAPWLTLPDKVSRVELNASSVWRRLQILTENMKQH
ncbi:MAG: single-stranded-DNA-specific exonuclease RecJ [Christensenellales bacterium]|jgi:single-stranded-DNA-specific exonuclease